jgi:Flp pilus assembly secretin CpaC
MKHILRVWLGIWTLAAGPLAAQEPRTLEMSVGAGLVVEAPGGVARVALADEALARVNVLNTKEVLLHGLANGRTTLFLWSETGERTEYTLRIRRDWSAIQGALKEMDPGVSVEESADSHTLLLKGKVASSLQSEKVAARAREILATLPEPRPGVVNLLQYFEQDPVAMVDSGLLEALHAIDSRIHLRRIRVEKQLRKDPAHPDLILEQNLDSYVLEGRVRNVRDLTKAIYLADRQLGGTGGRIQAADETRIRSNRQRSFGLDFGSSGQGSGARALDNELLPSSIAAQVARGLVISSESGRVISFLDVDDLQQVLVGIRVYEVDRQKARSLGVNYKVVGDRFAFAVSHVPNALSSTLGAANGLGSGIAAPVIRGRPAEVTGAEGGNVVGAIVSDSLALLAAIDVLQERAVARSVAEPNVLTLTGEEASVVVGGEVPIPTTAVGQVAAVQGFAFQTFGVRLAIRPTVADTGLITLEVAPSIVRPVPGLGNKDVPGFEVQTVQTTARVKAGESLLLGGLLTFVESEEERGIPILSRIPVLGYLFKWKKKIREEKELLFVMSPRLVSEQGLDRPIDLPGLETRDQSLDRQLSPQELRPEGLPQLWVEPEPKFPPDPCPDCPPAGADPAEPAGTPAEPTPDPAAEPSPVDPPPPPPADPPSTTSATAPALRPAVRVPVAAPSPAPPADAPAPTPASLSRPVVRAPAPAAAPVPPPRLRPQDIFPVLVIEDSVSTGK